MHSNLYEVNGLMFYTERQIQIRDAIVQDVLASLRDTLRRMNRAFDFIRVEAPILTPRDRINPNYTSDDVYVTASDLVLRPETTMGSYAAAVDLLNTHNDLKVKPPIVVWQHGKSFRQEQDQPTKFMRFKEFYQLEFQIIFAKTTGMDYAPEIKTAIQRALSFWVGPCRMEPSDRLPSYSTETTDIIRIENDMEVCSISRRTDFDGFNVIEVAVGTDRVMLNHLNYTASIL